MGGSCSSFTTLNKYYTYTTEHQFTMPRAEETVSYNCGVVPDIQIANQDPLQNIGVNETFTAGDFPVTVKEVEGSNGRFSGKGFIIVPYLADTRIAVAFKGISINTEYQLIDGVVQTTYDPTWGGVEDVDEFADDLGDFLDFFNDTFIKKKEKLEKLENTEDEEEKKEIILELENIDDLLDSGVSKLLENPYLTDGQREELKKLENVNAYASNDFDFKSAVDNLEATSNKVSEILAEAKEKEKADDFLNLDRATEIIEVDDEYSGFGCDLNDSSFKPLEHPHFYKGRRNLEVISFAKCHNGIVYKTKKGEYLYVYFDNELYENYQIYDEELKKWKIYTLGKPDCLSCDINKVFGEVLKFGGRYIVPVEDIAITIDAKDFEGNEIGTGMRILSGIFILVDIVPGGKSVTKPAKIVASKLLKKTIGESAAKTLEFYIKNKRTKIGEVVSGALKPSVDWITDLSAKSLKKVENISVWVNGKIEVISFEVVELGNKIGLRKILKYADEITHPIFKTADDLALTFDKLGEVSQKVRQQAFDLFKEKNWGKLEKLFDVNNINGKWPPNRGFIEFTTNPLGVGKEIDRYGGKVVNGKFLDDGTFASPLGASFESRALPSYYLTNPKIIKRKYKVIKEIPGVKKGPATPWFGQPGKGTQYELPFDIDKLLEDGYIILIN